MKNLVKISVEENSERIYENILQNFRESSFELTGLEGYLSATPTDNGGANISLSPIRPVEQVEEESRQESLTDTSNILLSYNDFEDEINNQELVNYLDRISLIIQNENVNIEYNEGLALVYSNTSTKEYHVSFGLKPTLSQREILDSIIERNQNGTLFTYIRKKRSVPQ